MPTTPASTKIGESQSLNERTRENIRLLKTLRRVSDEDIARLGTFTSRQVVADRVGGRTPLSLDDVDRIASALKVSRDALVGTQLQLMEWLAANEQQTNGEVTMPPMKGRSSKRKPAKRTGTKSR